MAMIFSDANFQDEVLNFSGVVLVDFSAVWCGPCKMQGPILDELEKELVGENIKIGKVDIDANPAATEKYGIMSVPTLIIFKNGEMVERMSGLQNKEILRKRLEEVKGDRNL
ncbi:thioredoxin [Candidatus Falkowbacteria bacterium]|nr:thioredoxin [Candidatus Falkowbacteria bacterium]